MRALYIEGLATHYGPGHAYVFVRTRAKGWFRGTCGLGY